MLRKIGILPGLVVLSTLFLVPSLWAQPSLGLSETLVSETMAEGAFPLVTPQRTAPLWYDGGDHAGVIRAVGDLQDDIERVTGVRPQLSTNHTGAAPPVIIGTVGRSEPIDDLAASGELGVSDLEGKRESFVITTVAHPNSETGRALVIAGSDRRGTIYGIYELSEQLGVSPWYWWADVPPRHRTQAYVLPGRYVSGEPAVRYRGIFLNNEWPALGRWTEAKFGGMNAEFYTKVFELLLRLRANYLWPAMWDSAFNEDDPANPRLADEYGIVMGTSHHEPMMRAHKEWTRRNEQYGNGEWNYLSNAEALRRFWREGIARNKEYENLVTTGMRGDGDVGMPTTGSLEGDIALLEQIIVEQRQILEEEMDVEAEEVPQMWALFTEVQKFYEAGMRVPDDITLLWTDDNTGNLRRLPTEEERGRSGGSGIYYHFDMHGGPYAYQWINTNYLPKVWEQMNLAYEYDANRIWIVNVGDLKPLEFPIEFFLRMAWDPGAIAKDEIDDFTLRWAEREFGSAHASDIADIVTTYTKYNAWRKPELVTPETYSRLHYREAERVKAAWAEVATRADSLYAILPDDQKAAYYQLVLYPTKASANLVRMNITAGQNHFYARQGRINSNALADSVRAMFRLDKEMAEYYNETLSDGKWNHLMDQPHIGQFTWEPPRINLLPPVSGILPEENANYGVAIEGDVNAWPGHYGGAVLPTFDSFDRQRSYIDVFAEGTLPIEYEVSTETPWIDLTPDTTRIDDRYWVEVDWSKAPAGTSTGRITVTGHREPVHVTVTAVKATDEQRERAAGRVATLTGPIAVEGHDAAENVRVGDVGWEILPNYGRGAAGMTFFPVTAESIPPSGSAPTLEYPVYLPEDGEVDVTLIVGPVMDFVPDRGMRIAVAFDDEQPEVIDIFENREAETFLGANWWNGFTKDNARYLESTHTLEEAGQHVLKVSMVDPGIVLQKIIINDAGTPLPDSYFGPPVMEVVPATDNR